MLSAPPSHARCCVPIEAPSPCDPESISDRDTAASDSSGAPGPSAQPRDSSIPTSAPGRFISRGLWEAESVSLPWWPQMTIFPCARFFNSFPSFSRRRRRKRSTRIRHPPSRTLTARTRTATGLSQPARGPSTRGSPARLRRRRRRRSTRRSPGTEQAGGGPALSPCCTPQGARAGPACPSLRGQGVSFSQK